MSLWKDNQLQNQSVNPNHLLVVNTLFVLKVSFHSKTLEAEVLKGLCLEDKLQGAYMEWLGKQNGAGSICSFAPPKISTDKNEVK